MRLRDAQLYLVRFGCCQLEMRIEDQYLIDPRWTHSGSIQHLFGFALLTTSATPYCDFHAYLLVSPGEHNGVGQRYN